MKPSGSLSLDSRVVASDDLVACDVSDEVVILSLKSGEYHGLNEVAAAVWTRLLEPSNVAALRDALLEEYEGVSAEACERELLATLTHMLELELIEVL